MSTGDLVLQFDDPPVSSDGCCPEDLNHSKPFGGAEGIAAPILDLGKDPAKHDLARVTVLVVGAVLGLGGHNGGSSFGVVGLGIIAQNQISIMENQKSPKRLVKPEARAYRLSEHKKKAPGGTSSDDIGQAIGSVRLGNCLPLSYLLPFNP